MIVFWFLLEISFLIAAVHLMGRNPWRRAASIFMLLAALFLPLYVPAIPLVRALLACLGLLALVKVVQIAQQPEFWQKRPRLWHALAPFDIADTQRVPRVVDRALLLAILAHTALVLLALTGLFLLPRVPPFALEILRLALGALLAYSAMEAITESVRFLHLLFGVAVPPLQRMPILSLSVQEFWSRRWNQPVNGWLKEFVFVPVARRTGAELGLFATFAVSGVLHGWMFYTALGWIPAILACAFFLLQALFVLIETAIRIRKLRPHLRRAWTLGLLGISSPLFVEPLLRVFAL